MKLNQKFPSELDIEDLHVKENIRKEYRDIPELAASLEKYGQMHEIGIDKDYNIIVGHRRYFGAKYLLETKGKRIKLRVHLIQGDRKTLQMIENLHQSEMTATEKEQGIESLIADGMKQNEIAKILCLSPQKVSDMRAAGRTREKAESQGVDTSEISTSGLSAMRSVDPDKMEEVIENANESGGTVSAIKKAVKDISKPKESAVNKYLSDYVVKKTHIKLLVKCSSNCRNNLDGYCDLKVIEIDDCGICSNLEES